MSSNPNDIISGVKITTEDGTPVNSINEDKIKEIITKMFKEQGPPQAGQPPQLPKFMTDPATIQELSFLSKVQNIVSFGEKRNTRNGNTSSMFGASIQFDISNSFPLLTSKKMYWKGIVQELLWFLKGSTNSNELKENGVHIWDGNSSREYLDSVGLSHYEEGDCGPIYGYQWRHFNAPYTSCNEPPVGGIDQLQECIRLLREDPTSRRIFMSAWNPCQLSEMCLPPCHVSYQFYVNSKNELSCMMYQRSGDMFLGVPFNIASTSLLVYILAHMTDKKPGKIMICIGDAHVYEQHFDAVGEQMTRFEKLYPFPQLQINCEKKERVEDYALEDFELVNYQCHPAIKAPMVA
jgi:thymidylate synthase